MPQEPRHPPMAAHNTGKSAARAAYVGEWSSIRDSEDVVTEAYGQRLDCLELAVRCVERWGSRNASARASEATEIAEIFREYLENGVEG